MFNILDLVIIAVILLSAIFAAWRGFTRETLSIGAWVGAAVLMFLFGEKAVPLAAAYIEHPMVAKIAAFAGVFVIALIPLAYISYRISEGVRDSFVGPVDRLLGLVFGVARGLIVVGIGFLVFTSLVGQARLPEWFKEARLRPLMESSGNVIASLLPDRSQVDTIVKDAEPMIGGKKKPPPEAVPAEEPVGEPAPAPSPPAKPKPARPAEEEPAPRTAKIEPKPKPAKAVAESEVAEPVKAAPKAKPVKAEPKPVKAEPKVKAAEEAAAPRAAKATPKAKPAPKPEPKAESGTEGYGERERDALDQLIGSATASPAKKPSED